MYIDVLFCYVVRVCTVPHIALRIQLPRAMTVKINSAMQYTRSLVDLRHGLILDKNHTTSLSNSPASVRVGSCQAKA